MSTRVEVGFIWPSREWLLFVLCPEGDHLRPEAVTGIRLPDFQIIVKSPCFGRAALSHSLSHSRKAAGAKGELRTKGVFSSKNGTTGKLGDGSEACWRLRSPPSRVEVRVDMPKV